MTSESGTNQPWADQLIPLSVTLNIVFRTQNENSCTEAFFPSINLSGLLSLKTEKKIETNKQQKNTSSQLNIIQDQLYSSVAAILQD